MSTLLLTKNSAPANKNSAPDKRGPNLSRFTLWLLNRAANGAGLYATASVLNTVSYLVPQALQGFPTPTNIVPAVLLQKLYLLPPIEFLVTLGACVVVVGLYQWLRARHNRNEQVELEAKMRRIAREEANEIMRRQNHEIQNEEV